MAGPRCIKACGLLAASSMLASTPGTGLAQSLDGDTGVAVLQSSSAVRGVKTRTSVIPFVYADYGRWFARIDTVGVRTLDVGKGSLELVARAGQDGWRLEDDAALNGLAERKGAALIGIGTFQRTEFGAFFAHLYHDVGHSKGSLLALSAVGRFSIGRAVAYPSLSLDWRDARYNRYTLGVTAEEAAAHPQALRAYQPTDAVVPKLGLLVDVPVSGPWHVLGSASVRALPSELKHSPLTQGSTEHTLLVAGVYRWQ